MTVVRKTSVAKDGRETCKRDSEEIVNSVTDVSKNSSVPLIISNPKLLDCCNCYQPLKIPVFQKQKIMLSRNHINRSSSNRICLVWCDPDCILKVNQTKLNRIEREVTSIGRIACSLNKNWDDKSGKINFREYVNFANHKNNSTTTTSCNSATTEIGKPSIGKRDTYIEQT
ncbi:hypothetical protein MTR_5g076680 [Medicago truncatula]|uniref:Uncharacterized protein n=1 Tax=Medicago truncatula TaxID=3880 RepID=G7KFS3_MEDTR|nr:hypothetical protein MTR_5g076680 [Medicago truncatula]